jgi:hypothetical protein
MASTRPVELCTLDELAEIAIQMQYANVACLDNNWYERDEIFKEIDNRVRRGKVVQENGL